MTPMTAHIQHDMHFTINASRNDHIFLAHARQKIVSRVFYLADMTDKLPTTTENSLHLKFVYILRMIYFWEIPVSVLRDKVTRFLAQHNRFSKVKSFLRY